MADVSSMQFKDVRLQPDLFMSSEMEITVSARQLKEVFVLDCESERLEFLFDCLESGEKVGSVPIAGFFERTSGPNATRMPLTPSECSKLYVHLTEPKELFFPCI